MTYACPAWGLAAVKLTTVQAAKLPLQHEIRKISMIYFAKPGLTEDLYIVQKEEFTVTCYVYVLYILLKKRQTHPLVERDITQGL
jgi:hypothetical protein